MLYLIVPKTSCFDEINDMFIDIEETKLQLEHSLVSISKWESKYCKPFLDRNYDRTYEETIDYVRCMTVNKINDDRVYFCLTPSMIQEINEYIVNPMTATTVRDTGKNTGRQIITSELIYCWMIELNIPIECEKWHLNRLMMLIRVCNARNPNNTANKKMSRGDMARQNTSLNTARRKALGTTG